MYDCLFICAANVGRSQMAEGFYNYYTKGIHSMSGAGIQDVGFKYDFKPHPGIIEVMRERNIDISNHRIKMVNQHMINNARRIILFFEEEKCPEYLKTYLHNRVSVGYRVSFVEWVHMTLIRYNKASVDYMVVKDPCPGDPNQEKPNELLERFRITRGRIEEIVLGLLDMRKGELEILANSH